jgi:hypothetical protein
VRTTGHAPHHDVRLLRLNVYISDIATTEGLGKLKQHVFAVPYDAARALC